MQILPGEGTGKFNDLWKEREVVLLISMLEYSKVLLTWASAIICSPHRVKHTSIEDLEELWLPELTVIYQSEILIIIYWASWDTHERNVRSVFN